MTPALDSIVLPGTDRCLFDHCFEGGYPLTGILKAFTIICASSAASSLIIRIMEVLLYRAESQRVLGSQAAQFFSLFAILCVIVTLGDGAVRFELGQLLHRQIKLGDLLILLHRSLSLLLIHDINSLAR